MILVDQRGTGKLQSAGVQATTKTRRRRCGRCECRGRGRIAGGLARDARKCRDQLARKADRASTPPPMRSRDLDAVREALGAQQINLVGVSYGTRVAQQYATRYPQHTRTIVLDGVVPNALVLGNELRAQPRSARSTCSSAAARRRRAAASARRSARAARRADGEAARRAAGGDVPRRSDAAKCKQDTLHSRARRRPGAPVRVYAAGRRRCCRCC